LVPITTLRNLSSSEKLKVGKEQKTT